MIGIFGKVRGGGILLEIRRLTYEHIDDVIKLYEFNKNEFERFTPHPFTRDGITKIIETAIFDLYYVVIFQNTIIGYGMLRGMDEGYNNFSLGIAIDKNYYGTGLAKVLVGFLELQARVHGHSAIRLRVFKNNIRAYNLYKNLGYEYTEYDSDSVVGAKKL